MLNAMIFVGLALVFALVLIRVVTARGATQRRDVEASLAPISVPAMMNLIDGSNLEFLERSLPAAEFRKAKRERCRALRVYVQRIASNTRILIAHAEAAQRASDPAVAESSRLVLESLLATRTRAVRALAWLYISEVFPNFLPDVSQAIQNYQAASARMDDLQSLTSR